MIRFCLANSTSNTCLRLGVKILDISETAKKKKIHLTFDIDWSPDDSINEIRDILNPRNIKATFFVTHRSDILKDLEKDGHELGIHPNFFSNSSQGSSTEKVIESLLNIVPKSRSLRTHSLMQSGPLLENIFSRYINLKYDLSTLTYGFSAVGSFQWFYNDTHFTRINYNWEDDMAFFDKNFSWNSTFSPGELNVYNFHPIHVHLNSNSNKNYTMLKNILNGPLNTVDSKIVSKYQNNGLGAKTFLTNLVNSELTHIDFEELICV